MKKLKLKVGNKVWVRLPLNAIILRVNKKYGYTLKTENGDEYCYFDDNDVKKLKVN